MSESTQNPSNQSTVDPREKLSAAFKQLHRINTSALIVWSVGAAVVVAGLFDPLSYGTFDSDVIIFAYLISLVPTVFFWLRSRAILQVTDLGQQLVKYDKLQGSQAFAGTLAIIGAVAMLPASFILYQMFPNGWAIMFNVFGGGFIGLGLKKVQQVVRYYRAVESHHQLQQDGSAADGNALQGAVPLLPPEVKRPIASGLVWVGGILLLAINLMLELFVYSSIRNHGMANGVLRDYGAQLTFLLYQFFDLFVLTIFGVILLVLAIINLTRVRDKGPAMIAIAIVAAGLAIFPGGFSTVLAGVAGPSDSLVQTRTEADKSTETIQAIMDAGPIPGFEGVYEEFYDCREGGCSDSLMRLAKEVGPESLAVEYCDYVVSFAAGVGLTEYATAPDYESRSIEAVETRSDCVATLDDISLAAVQQYQAYSKAFVIEGTSSIGAKAPVRMVLTQAINGNLDDNPGFHTYFLEITTTFQTGPYATPGSGLSQGTVEINDLLDLIGQQRLANPDRDPMDKAFIEEILAEYPHQIDMELVANASGEIHRIHLTNSEGTELCLSIEPWESDPFNEGIPDPGMGYGLGFMESLDVLRGFGNAVEGSCG